MKILVVDDSASMRWVIEKIIRELGYTDVELVNSAASASQTIAKSPPDCILLDWYMPETDGITFLKTLKENPATRPIPVLMLTTENSIENVGLAIEAGAEGYILKPVNKEALGIRLSDIAQKRTLGLKK